MQVSVHYRCGDNIENAPLQPQIWRGNLNKLLPFSILNLTGCNFAQIEPDGITSIGFDRDKISPWSFWAYLQVFGEATHDFWLLRFSNPALLLFKWLHLSNKALHARESGEGIQPV